MTKQINIQEALDWYIWAGVVETCGDFACIEENKIQTDQVVRKEENTQQVKQNLESSAVKNAKDLCRNISSLNELFEELRKFNGCNLKSTAASTVIGEGNCNADIMFIGEAPGADEDKIGKPFVGRCGKLLDKMLSAIDLNREDCYITNVLPWRPPGNRTPTDDELATCLPFLKKQIELIKPKVIVLLGGIALKSLMDSNDSISRTRGKWLEYENEANKPICVIATYHPSFLLRSSSQKSRAWTDFLRLKNKIKELEVD